MIQSLWFCRVSIAFVAIVAMAMGIRLLLIYASNKLVFAIGHDIGVKLYRVILDQPYAYHISQNTSDVIANVNKVQILLGAFLRPAMVGVTSIILSIAILTALLLVDAATALTAGILFTTIYLIVIGLFRARLKRGGEQQDYCHDPKLSYPSCSGGSWGNSRRYLGW